MKYTIEFTDLAKAFAPNVGGLNALEEQVRGELADLGRCYCGECDGYKVGDETHYEEFDINNLIMHVVMMKDDKGRAVEFVCSPGAKENVLRVDTATYEEIEQPLESGPFKGKKVLMPRGDSDD
jgi:hypothetical protein